MSSAAVVIGSLWVNMVMPLKDAFGMAHSINPNQTAPQGTVLLWVYTVCLGLSVAIFSIFTFFCKLNAKPESDN